MNLNKETKIIGLCFSLTLLGLIIPISHNNRSFSNEASTPFPKCSHIKLNELTSAVFRQLSTSKDLSPLSMSCNSVGQINQIQPAKLMITTGRKAGNNIVCISGSKRNPCTFKVASFKDGVSPSDSLLKIFNSKPIQSEILYETTSRVFIFPQELIENGNLKTSKKITKRDK